MKHAFSLALMIVSLASLLGCVHGGPRQSALDRLVGSERAFCLMAREKTVKDAFLDYLSDDAVMFLPRPVNGKQAYAARPASQAGLIWEPAFASVSAAGDLGYTFGPWEYRKNRDQGMADEYGHFVSVWQKQPDGRWKVILDSGISHPRPPGPVVKTRLSVAPGREEAPVLDSRERKNVAGSLLSIDQDLSDTISSTGAREKLLTALSDGVDVFVESRFPASGKAAARSLLEADTSAYRWQPVRAIVSASGDLGYVYGTANSYIHGKPAGELSYLRIWEKRPDGTWAIVVLKTNPIEE